jgi:ribosomal protein S12 methylthiotransferase accessory factor YcaO
MTMWLTQIPPPLINTNYLTDKKIQFILNQILKYNLQLYLFDITHDLEVPCFMSVLIDTTGYHL